MTAQAPPARPRKRSILSLRRASGRLALAFAIGVGATLPFLSHPVEWWVRAVIGWDAASLALTALLWGHILRADATQT